ncbi:MAG TPA: PAS domain S-box protein [Bryobacteraceae bacterium]|nr:PAS domain S-box protein [Bryobacteraceae bacterium]
MRRFLAYRRFESWPVRYLGAIALAEAGPLTCLPLRALHFTPLVPRAPFIVISALALGLGPGLVTTLICVVEAIYETWKLTGSLGAITATDWERAIVIGFTGVFASVMAERLTKSYAQLKDANRKNASVLESISDGFLTLNRKWCFTYVNPAAARMTGLAAEEYLGKNLWELWPHAAASGFGAAYLRAVRDNVPVQVEAFYPDPLNAWFEVRCYPSAEGLTVFFNNTSERRRREEQLRFFESAALQTSDGVLILKISGDGALNGEPVFLNSAFERITGFGMEDLKREGLQVLIAPAEIHSDSTYLERSTRRKNGCEFWAEYTFTAIEDVDGAQTHWVCTLRDITERKRAEEAARLFTSIVEHSDDAIVSKTLDGVILTWNKSAERIYGYSAGEMVGQNIARLMPPGNSSQLTEIFDNLRRGERLEHVLTQRVRKDGSLIAVSVTISPLRDAAGYIVGASAITRDVTEQQRVEKALALSEERYRSLAFATSQIVWTANVHGEVIEDIPMWRAFTGQSEMEALAMGWIAVVHPEDRERTREVWLRAVKIRSFYDTEYRLRRADGAYRWMAVHAAPVLEVDGTIREWVITCADIEDRKQAEAEIAKLNEELEQRVLDRTAELEAANRELEAFSYSVSHDLRAPLRAMDGFSRILLEEYSSGLPEKAQHYLTVIRSNAVQMGELIDDLLAFARLSRQPLNKQPVALDDLVKQALEDLAIDREGRRVEMLVGDLPACEGDPQLLKQVLINLLSNGLKYTRARDVARIEVGAITATGPNPPIYYVRDNGVGFDMRYANKLFGVFQRLHGAKEYPGTGVGLAIVQRIVHRHGGRVWAEAQINHGATFYFMLAQAGTKSNEELLACSSHN